jgi:hypothetical protein
LTALIEAEVWVYPDASVTMVDGAYIADDPAGEEGNMSVAGIVYFHAGIVDGFIDTLYGTITVPKIVGEFFRVSFKSFLLNHFS